MRVRPLVLAGPSAVGKTTVAKELMSIWESFALLRSATTRAPRGDGNDGEYIYLSREDFLSLVDSGDMLEHMEYAGELYGTPRSELLRVEEEGRIPLLILDLTGVVSLSELDGITPFSVYIYDSPEVLESRLAARYGEGSPRYTARLEQNERDRTVFETLRHYFSAVIKNDTTPRDCALRIGRNYFERI